MLPKKRVAPFLVLMILVSSSVMATFGEEPVRDTLLSPPEFPSSDVTSLADSALHVEELLSGSPRFDSGENLSVWIGNQSSQIIYLDHNTNLWTLIEFSGEERTFQYFPKRPGNWNIDALYWLNEGHVYRSKMSFEYDTQDSYFTMVIDKLNGSEWDEIGTHRSGQGNDVACWSDNTDGNRYLRSYDLNEGKIAFAFTSECKKTYPCGSGKTCYEWRAFAHLIEYEDGIFRDGVFRRDMARGIADTHVAISNTVAFRNKTVAIAEFRDGAVTYAMVLDNSSNLDTTLICQCFHGVGNRVHRGGGTYNGSDFIVYNDESNRIAIINDDSTLTIDDLPITSNARHCLTRDGIADMLLCRQNGDLLFWEISNYSLAWIRSNSLDIHPFGKMTSTGERNCIELYTFLRQHVQILWSDIDGDGISDDSDSFPWERTQSQDIDGDGYGDNPLGDSPDGCPSFIGNSTIDQYGCKDRDGDGWSDSRDVFPNDPYQWNDTDTDGYGDNADNRTNGDWDDCPYEFGTSDRDSHGCPDQDGDGWSDDSDAFPEENSQWSDEDSDGFGDNLLGFRGDSCKSQLGSSVTDRFGCPDSDGDGWSDEGDDLPSEKTQWRDRDGDGYGDNQSGNSPDLFPSDGTQWNDSDGDGHGDNRYGSEGDWFPDDPSRWQDSDRDGVDDSNDAFPNDASQSTDRDGDGYGDSEKGNRADVFPDDANEWTDSDGDGRGNNGDSFPFDPTQWSDVDGDGYGDNPAGRLADAFPANPTQWEDLDGDGLGDNQSGTDADPYLDDFDNDGYNDSIDILPKFASPGDLDGDGCLDDDDAFPSDARECSDADGDGVGDNADADDDNDGALDTEEAIAGTNQFSSSSKPIESFEIILPGTSIGLGAWDLIGIFGGIPFFSYLALMISTRSPRVRRFEEDLYEARSEAELADISARYERAMLFRLIGPHHGLRLERIRSKLENRFESTSQGVSDGDMWTAGLDTSSAPDTSGSAPSADQMGQVSSDGYEWLSHGGAQYYRAPHSGQEWTRWG